MSECLLGVQVAAHAFTSVGLFNGDGMDVLKNWLSERRLQLQTRLLRGASVGMPVCLRASLCSCFQETRKSETERECPGHYAPWMCVPTAVPSLCIVCVSLFLCLAPGACCLSVLAAARIDVMVYRPQITNPTCQHALVRQLSSYRSTKNAKLSS
jgi:hypothetical protein